MADVELSTALSAEATTEGSLARNVQIGVLVIDASELDREIVFEGRDELVDQ